MASTVPIYSQVDAVVSETIASAEWGKSFITKYGIYFAVALVLWAGSKMFKFNLKTGG